MDPNTAFFVEALVLQLAFTGILVVLVGRRYPARLRVYRYVAPAAVPMLLLAFAVYAYVRLSVYQGLALGGGVFVRLGLAYAVLWLVGVLFAGLMIRLVRPRPGR